MSIFLVVTFFQYQVRLERTCVLTSMDLSEVQISEDGRTQVCSLCIWNRSVLDYVTPKIKKTIVFDFSVNRSHSVRCPGVISTAKNKNICRKD